jgi:hypothetical protein
MVNKWIIEAPIWDGFFYYFKKISIGRISGPYEKGPTWEGHIKLLYVSDSECFSEEKEAREWVEKRIMQVLDAKVY